MKYQVLVEYDPETKSYAASVPGVPVYADADTEEEALKLAKEGLAWYLEDAPGASKAARSARVRAKLVSVDV